MPGCILHSHHLTSLHKSQHKTTLQQALFYLTCFSFCSSLFSRYSDWKLFYSSKYFLKCHSSVIFQLYRLKLFQISQSVWRWKACRGYKTVDCFSSFVLNPPTVCPHSQTLSSWVHFFFFSLLLTVSLWPQVNSQKHNAQCQLSGKKKWFNNPGEEQGSKPPFLCAQMKSLPAPSQTTTFYKSWSTET